MKFFSAFVVVLIFFFPALQAVNGDSKDDVMSNLMQEQMGERQSSYPASDTPSASLQDSACLKWKLNVAKKIVQALTQEIAHNEVEHLWCNIPCINDCLDDCSGGTLPKCEHCLPKCCSYKQEKEVLVAKGSFLTTQGFSDRCLRCVRECYRLYEICMDREGASQSGCFSKYNTCKGYCGCGSTQKYVAEELMYTSVAKAQADLDATREELKYIVESAPQNCYI